MKSQSVANPMPFIFAVSLFLVLIAVLIAISQFGRTSSTYPPVTHSSQDVSPVQVNATSPVREKTNILMTSIGAMTLMVIAFSAVVSVMLNRRHAQRMVVVEQSLTAAQRLSVEVSPHTERCIRDYSNWKGNRRSAWSRR